MRHGVVAALALCFALTAAGCGGLKYRTQGVSRATGADAQISARVDQKSKLTRFSLTIENLPPPDRIEDGSTEFVVWARANDTTAWKRIGSLNYDANSRKGTLPDASIPEISAELIVTAEKQAAPESPSATAVISQVIGR